MSPKKNILLDTSVCLTDSESIYKFGDNDIFLPLKVLEEIDKHKKRQDSVGSNARKVIRTLDELRAKGNLQKGVSLGEGKGILKVMSYGCVSSVDFPPDLDLKIPDHVIIATGMALSTHNPHGSIHATIPELIIVSNDINMRVICDSLGLKAQDYKSEEVVTNTEDLYDGFSHMVVDDETIDQFYLDKDIFLDKFDLEDEDLSPNQYLMLSSVANSKKTCLVRFEDGNSPLKKIIHTSMPDWNIKPRNKEQSFAIDMLLDPSIKLISLIGRAGSGKTLCAIAAGLQQTIGSRDNLYSRLIVSRPIQPMGKDIGFLPGTMQEKMLPWLMPIQDNLQFLMGDKTNLEMYLEKGKIEIEALTYIRGRSISDAFIVIDEAQNLTRHEIKTIITRIGENTKIILTGDIEQIDNIYVNETSNGLAHAVESFKKHKIAGHITFRKGERSELATLASKIM
jgi:PhoH-like ATPase